MSDHTTNGSSGPALPATLPDGSPLPGLHTATLDFAAVRAMAAAIADADPDAEVLVKHGAMVEGETAPTSPVRAVAMLCDGLLHGVQLRYRLDGHAFVDTLRRADDSVAVVRMNLLQFDPPR